MTPIPTAGLLLPTLLTGLAVPAYVVWALPRLSARAAAALTTTVTAACTASALAFGPTWWLPAAAFFVGHLGWALGRRSGQPGRGSRSPAGHDANATPPSTLPFVGGRATLGRYLLVREIGRGSMGAVWLAHDPLHDRAVALKTLALRQKAVDADTVADARARFFREAAAARGLDHPAIVRIFDAGEADGMAYLAMEYLTGDNLVTATRPGTLLPVATVLQVVARVARALADAHARGVVHRDVKPANVMFDRATGRVTLTDFGVASVGDTLRTRTGVLLGTPAYMSPEQLGGRHLDGRSDLYALGVLLFQLLTGELPHRAESMGDLLAQIGGQPAPDLRSRRPGLPAGIADIVALALEKRPDRRWADGVAMALALERVLQEVAPDAPPPTRAPL